MHVHVGWASPTMFARAMCWPARGGRMSIPAEAEPGRRSRAVQVGLNLVEEAIHPRSLEKILDVPGVAIELMEGRGGDGGLAGLAGSAWSGGLVG